MICINCKHYEDGVTDYGPYNECRLFGFEHFCKFEEKCPYIDDEHNLTEEGIEASGVF